jgi:hypothetical protein
MQPCATSSLSRAQAAMLLLPRGGKNKLSALTQTTNNENRTETETRPRPKTESNTESRIARALCKTGHFRALRNACHKVSHRSDYSQRLNYSMSLWIFVKFCQIKLRQKMSTRTYMGKVHPVKVKESVSQGELIT